MRNLILLIVVVLMVAGGCGYKKNPRACQKLGLDMADDLVAIFTPTGPTKSPPEEPSVADVPSGPAPAPTTQAAPPPVQPPLPDATVGSLLQNGDFSAGDSQWQGDGRTDRTVAKALIVPLNADSWTKVWQDFKGDKATDTITISYRLSPDFSASNRPEDYTNIGDHVRFEDYEGYGTVELPVGYFLVWIGDLTNHASRYERYPLRPSPDAQTIEHTFPSGAALADKMITLAFPPGTGSVILLSVAVKSN